VRESAACSRTDDRTFTSNDVAGRLPSIIAISMIPERMTNVRSTVDPGPGATKPMSTATIRVGVPRLPTNIVVEMILRLVGWLITLSVSVVVKPAPLNADRDQGSGGEAAENHREYRDNKKRCDCVHRAIISETMASPGLLARPTLSSLQV